MLRFARLPTPFANWLQVVRPMFRHCHPLVFCWFLVCQAVYQEKATVKGLARTWCCENGQALKDLVTHLPKKHYRRCWVPLEEPGRRRTYWTYTKRACLRHIGDVTIIIQNEGRKGDEGGGLNGCLSSSPSRERMP
jgi:hypothetical protein